MRAVRPAIIAHRGASTHRAEHTFAAYALALEQGAEGLECDVRLTRDGHLVCVHDRRVDRTSSGTGVVSTLSLERMSQLDYSGWHAAHPDEPQGLLTLDALLALAADAAPGTRLFIETKHPVRYGGLVEAKLIALLRRYGLATPPSKEDSPVVVMSFSARAIDRVRRHSATLPTVLLLGPLAQLRRDAPPVSADYVGPSIDLLRADPGYVARAAPNAATTRTAGRWTSRRTSSCANDLACGSWPPTRPRPPVRSSRPAVPVTSRPDRTGEQQQHRSRLVAKRHADKRKPAQDGINPRQPCPCGSGKRYKACHGASGGVVDVPVARPFEGLAGECELVALREFVPSATAPLRLTTAAEREVSLATVLPMAAAAIVRADGAGLIGMQVQTRSSDVSRDLARAIRWALAAEPGDVLPVIDTISASADGERERLQDLVAADAPIEPELHPDFAWWMPPDTEPTGEVALSLERANSAILPTERIGPAAYWVDAGDKAHLRWVRPEPEERLLAALARLAAAGTLALGEGSRYAGSFRAHGLLVPVWDLDPESHAREWTEPAAELGTRLEHALSSLDSDPLTGDERRARDGLLGRQVTIR